MFERWRGLQKITAHNALRQRQADELRRRDEALRRLYGVKRFLRAPGGVDKKEKFKIVFGSLWKWGSSGPATPLTPESAKLSTWKNLGVMKLLGGLRVMGRKMNQYAMPPIHDR